MAGTDCCTVEGCSAPRASRGLCPKHYVQLRKYGEVGPRRYTCPQCGIDFLSERKKVCCSVKCNNVRQSRKAGMVPLAEYRKSIRNEKENAFVCERCGKQMYRRNSSTNRKKGSPQRWCSQACRTPAWIGSKPPYCRLVNCLGCHRLISSKAKRCKSCTLKYTHEQRTLRLGVLRDKREARVIACKGCGAEFRKADGVGPYCGGACRDAAIATANRERRQKYGAKFRERARYYGVIYEPVNVMYVFERDGWRCQICGKVTPRERRGSFRTNAPELDHRIPMAKGGPHSYENVQCACRACNLMKGSTRIVGQLSLLH